MLRSAAPDRRHIAGCGVLWLMSALLALCSLVCAQDGQHAKRTRKERTPEEIFIARSVRESRVQPTQFCTQSKTGFHADAFEDRYTFRSLLIQTSDGRVINGSVKTVGAGHACFGRTADPAVLDFYLELQLGKVELRGTGDCRQTKADFPEPGVNAWRCFLVLSDSLGAYTGGQLTTNSITSRKDLGLETDPPGYAQSSIATIRLWRKQ